MTKMAERAYKHTHSRQGLETAEREDDAKDENGSDQDRIRQCLKRGVSE